MVDDVNHDEVKCQILEFQISKVILSTHPIKVTQSPDCSVSMVKLRQILDDISRAMRQPTIPTLEQISQSTMDTLRQQRQQQQDRADSAGQAGSRPSSASKGFSWASWTLPKKRDSAKNNAAAANANASSQGKQCRVGLTMVCTVPLSALVMLGLTGNLQNWQNN